MKSEAHNGQDHRITRSTDGLFLACSTCLISAGSIVPYTCTIFNYSAETRNDLRTSIVQIEIYSLDPDTSSNDVRAYTMKTGLGTLIKVAEEAQVLSHAHWGDLSTVVRVIINNADGFPLIKIDGEEIRSKIKFSDAGSLLFILSEDVIKDWGLTIATVSSELSMDVGDLVLVPHQNPVQTECVSFIEARIERFQMGQGLPAFTMRSTSDKHIIRGDSGGGIWFNGSWWGIIGNPR